MRLSRSPALALSFALAVDAAAAVRLPASDGGFATVEEPILITAEGIRHVPPGAPAPEVLAWKALDLRALATRHPEVERARRTVLLTGTPVLVEDASPHNPWRAFLMTPLSMTFAARVRSETRTVRQQTPVVVVTGTGAEAASATAPLALVNERSRTTTEVRDETPAELDTTIEGLLTVISDYQNSLSGRRLRDLRTTPEFLPRLIASFRELGQLLPGDHEISTAIRALEKLQADAAVSVDAQRALARFLNHARAQATAWSRAAGEP